METIPFASTGWDEIVPGLFMGGHYVLGPDGRGLDRVVVTHEFDVVVSLFSRPNHGPAEHVVHHVAAIADDRGLPLPTYSQQLVRDAADRGADALGNGLKVLVRCQAGYNRSGLVVAFILLRQGWTAGQAIDEIRLKRSPLALHNEQFVRLIHTEAVRLSHDSIEAVS